MATKILHFFSIMPTLTVFTPTYNRAYCLHLGYEGLCRQTCKDFVWLIIDDGSTDGTRQLVEQWMTEGKVDIIYHYQENQGMHGAHNTAYSLIETELNTCIDSDDYMPDDAVEKIVNFWRENGSDKYAGIVGLDVTFDNKVIGTELPRDRRSTRLDLFYSNGGRGDKKLVYRTEVIRQYPEYPVFEGEKYLSLGYIYQLIDQDYELLILNEPICKVEYRADGSSMNMLRQYIRNPRSFAFLRKSAMQLAPTWKRRFIECIHYVSSSIMIRNRNFIQESPKKVMTVGAIPFGVALYLYIMYKTRNNK